MRNVLLGCGLYLVHYAALAQQFGGNPPYIKWEQINSDTARIIFPVGLDSVAQRVANIVHWLAKNNPAPLGSTLHKINIVLQTQTTIANGYVALAPYRSEYFLTPSLNNFDEGSIGWAEGLAVHEFRHVQQYNNFRNGLSKVAYYLFGQEGFAVAADAAIPNWFYEGDAVYNETITTNQGRGRIPFFLNQYKSLWLQNKAFSWMKLRNGSLKDYVPNHYPLGYLMVNYGREKYGLDFWTKVTRDASAFKGLFYPFQKAIERYSGVDFRTFHENAFGYYRSLELKPPGQTTLHDLTKPTRKFVTDYLFPYQENDSLIFLKMSFRQRPAFVVRSAGRERRIRARDISIDKQFSFRNGRIVYSAYEPDARWGWKDFSVIKILDIRTGREQTLMHRTKYFTPDLSPRCARIAAVQVLPGGRSELHVLDAGSGKIIQEFHSDEINLFTDPKFIDENFLVTAVRLNDGSMCLALANIDAGSIVRLTDPSYGVLGYPSVSNGIVYFTGSYSGNDELYAFRLADKKIFQVTKTALGNYFVSAKGDKLTWSQFTADGYQLKEINIDSTAWTGVTELEIANPLIEFPVAHSNELHDVLTRVPNRKFTENRYRQTGHLFHFHSWRPYFADPDFTYSLYGDNILNTFSTELFYHYNRDDKTNGFGANLLYGAWYPFMDGGLEYTFNQPVTVNDSATQINKLETTVGLSVPLNFTSGRTFKFLDFGTDYVFDQQFFKGVYKASIGHINFSYLHHFVTWSHYVEQAVQHIYPRFGYAIALHDRHAITKYNSYQVIGSASVFLPGFFSTHSVVFTASAQQRDTTNILFSNAFVNARGYNDYYFSRMWRLSANYHFPIAYPDWGFANILYFQRIRGNIFFDFERVYSKDKTVTADLHSVGGELYFDTKWWNEYPLTFGIRLSHLLDNELGAPTQKNVFEILVPIVIPQ